MYSKTITTEVSLVVLLSLLDHDTSGIYKLNVPGLFQLERLTTCFPEIRAIDSHILHLS